ncbi:MAG: hypothetical protein WC058_12045, partial [Phycisphaeraceae bacterium]
HGVKKPRFCFKNGGKTSQCSTIFRQTFVFGSKTAITRERLPKTTRPLNLQPQGPDAKPYQIRQFLQMVDEFGLTMEKRES